MKLLNKILNSVNWIIKHFLNLILVVLTVSVFMQVIFRFVINNPLAWTEELARYCLIWLTFLGAAYAMSLKAHIGVEFFTNLFSRKIKNVMLIFATFISIGFFLMMIIYGFELTQSGMGQLSSVLQIPMGYIYSVIPISGILLILNIIVNTINEIKAGGDIT